MSDGIIGTDEIFDMLGGESQGGGFLQNLLGISGGEALGGAAALGLLGSAYNRLGDIGERGLGLGQELAETQIGQAAFRPYTVTTATGGQFTAGMGGAGPSTGGQMFGGGTSSFDESTGEYVNGAAPVPAGGGLQFGMQLSPQEQAMYQNLFGGAGQFYQQAAMPTGQREAEVFERMRAIQRPEEERQRLALEERLAEQGRLGLRTAQFGGAPEQFALAQAQEEARNRAVLGAMQQAQAEQIQQAQLGQQFLAGSYVPQAQLLSALTPGMTAAGQAQQAQLYGTGLFGEATASGIDALLGAALGQANLFGAAGTGVLSGLFGGD